MQPISTNAAPMLISLGTEDLSLVAQTPAKVNVPQHCPKQFLFAKKGKLTPQLTVGSEMVSMYGADTFDPTKKFFNHATAFANLFNKNGNAMMVQRLVPDDATTVNMLLVCDVLVTDDYLYERNTNGHLIYDISGNPIKSLVQAPVVSFQYYWIDTSSLDYIKLTTDVNEVTTAEHYKWTPGQGFQGQNGGTAIPAFSSDPLNYVQQTVDGGNTTVTTVKQFIASRQGQVHGSTNTGVKYLNKVVPVLEITASSPGEWANNSGIVLSALTAVNNQQFPSAILSQEKAYPYSVQFYTRKDANSAAVPTSTILGSLGVTFTLKPGSIDPNTDSQVYIGNNVLQSYQNLTNPAIAKVYADYGTLGIYQDNIDYLQNLALTMEWNAYSAANTAFKALPANTTHQDLNIYDFVTDNAIENLIANQVDGLPDTYGPSNGFYNTAATDSGFFGFNNTFPGSLSSATPVPLDVSVIEFPNKYTFNIFTGLTSNGKPLETWRKGSDVKSFNLTRHNISWGKSGSDGTIDDVTFANLVSVEMERYLDPNDVLQEVAINVESVIYDSGFDLDTKKALLNFIAVRKDTAVMLATHQVTDSAGDAGPTLTPDQEYSTAVTLRTAAQLFPESEYFGTPVSRVGIIGVSGEILNSQFTKRMPLLYDVADKFSQYMGASNGIWNSLKAVSSAADGNNNIVTTMNNLNMTWVPPSARTLDWSVGLNWVQAFDTNQFFYPAFKTVYSGVNSDSSVLNSIITMFAICELNKIGAETFRNFTGSNRWTSAQLVDKVNKFVETKIANRFDNRFVIVPDCKITSEDAIKGYSFTLPIKIYAADMTTVMTTYVQAFNINDYSASNA